MWCHVIDDLIRSLNILELYTNAYADYGAKEYQMAIITKRKVVLLKPPSLSKKVHSGVSLAGNVLSIAEQCLSYIIPFQDLSGLWIKTTRLFFNL